MKKFKDFISPKDFKYDPEKMGNPVLIMQGKHSLPKSKQKYNSDTMGNPALIKQGGHSVDKIKEDYTNAWDDHNPQYRGKYVDDDNSLWGSRLVKPTKHPAQIGFDRFQRAIAEKTPSLHRALFDKFHEANPVNAHIEGGDLEDVHRHLSAHYDASEHPHYSPIRRYSSGSGDLNRHLFDAHMGGYDPGDRINSHNIPALDSALSHQGLHTPLTVFSGLHFNPKESASGNGRLFLPAYTSTSISSKIASDFGKTYHRNSTDQNWDDNIPQERHMLKMDLPEGQKGYYLGDHSDFDNEKEFLLPRRSVIQLHSTAPETINYKNPYADRPVVHTMHIWHGRVMKPHEYE